MSHVPQIESKFSSLLGLNLRQIPGKFRGQPLEKSLGQPLNGAYPHKLVLCLSCSPFIFELMTQTTTLPIPQSRPLNWRRNLAPALVMLILSGCEHVEKVANDSDKIAKKLVQDLGLEEADSQSIQKAAQDEVDKLMQVEYLVEEVPGTFSKKALQDHLSKLGADRWECFSVTPHGDGSMLRIICKRKPKSYLRYLTRAF